MSEPSRAWLLSDRLTDLERRNGRVHGRGPPGRARCRPGAMPRPWRWMGKERPAASFPLSSGVAHGQAARPLAVVTGASTGIGYELAKCCAREGFDLVVVADEMNNLHSFDSQGGASSRRRPVQRWRPLQARAL